jgi:hypothetical protein
MIYCLECVGEGARQFLKFGSIAEIPMSKFLLSIFAENRF